MNSTPTVAAWNVYTPSCRAPSARGGAFRRPCNVWVVLSAGSPNAIHGRNVYDRRLVARNVDSRYDGPKSAYGQAIHKARALRDALSLLGGLC